jgi:hypothetical protein
MPASWGADIATAALAVARKLVTYLLVVDKSRQPFQMACRWKCQDKKPPKQETL